MGDDVGHNVVLEQLPQNSSTKAGEQEQLQLDRQTVKCCISRGKDRHSGVAFQVAMLVAFAFDITNIKLVS